MRIFCPFLFFLSSFSLLQAETVADVAPLVEAANAFLDSLDSAQTKIAKLGFDSADREDWHYVPRRRTGLAWREMHAKQKTLSWALFHAALSQAGTTKAEGVIAAEAVLWARANHANNRDPENYHVSIFGHPATGASWGASLEGHHLSINLTVVNGKEVFVTPSFFGANPDQVTSGNQARLRPLKGEAEEARKLLKMLDAEQRQRAVIQDKAPREILTGAAREVSPLPVSGLPAAAMTTDQKVQLHRVLTEYVDRYHTPYAKDDWAKIEAAGIDKIYFAWAGSDQPGEPMYYRLQGPTFIMEYVNVQNGGNHSHTVWRDFENDFGRDFLKEHLEISH